MTTWPQGSAAAHTVRVGAEEWAVRPLTVRDWSEFIAWVQDRYVDLVRRNTAALAADQSVQYMRDAFSQAMRIGTDTPEMKAALESPEGAARLVWMSVRRDRPGLTAEAFFDLMQQADATREVSDAFRLANGSADPNSSAEPPAPPAPLTT